MAKYTKWLGAGAGWIFGGPIGGIIGFAIGALVDGSIPDENDEQNNGATTPTDFTMSLMVLIAAVMKADGKVLRSELDFTRQYLLRTFGWDGTQELLMVLRDILQRDIPVHDVCLQIRDNLDYSSRLELMHLLYGVAQADGEISIEEERTIEQIGASLGLSPADCASIRAMFIAGKNWVYEVLEIEPSATDDEIKKAYRKMAVKYHPDKVSYLGDDVQKSANEKFQKVNEAYEKIKKDRGFN
jgi:DnaJ like chaperone protein